MTLDSRYFINKKMINMNTALSTSKLKENQGRGRRVKGLCSNPPNRSAVRWSTGLKDCHSIFNSMVYYVLYLKTQNSNTYGAAVTQVKEK